MAELDLLRSIGDDLVPPPFALLQETARRRTRRARAAALAAVVTLATVGVIGAHLLDGPDDQAIPIGPIDDVRPLSYADGAQLHLGDDVITAAAPVTELDLTDAGAVFRTDDGRIWSTDGVHTAQVGDLGEPAPAYARGEPPIFEPGGWVVTPNSGPLAAWFEFPEPSAPVVVVYDTTARKTVVDRVPVTVRGARWELPAAIDSHAVYWFVDTELGDDAIPA